MNALSSPVELRDGQSCEITHSGFPPLSDPLRRNFGIFQFFNFTEYRPDDAVDVGVLMFSSFFSVGS